MIKKENLKNGTEMKALYVEIDVNTHCEIRKRAAVRNTSIKKWIIRAIFEEIAKEDKYDKDMRSLQK